MKKLISVLAVAAAVGGFSSQAAAIGRLADINVTDRSTSATLPVYLHRGEYWVAGTPGAKYAIDIRNASERRVLAVTSVDGVNVVSGETASTAQTGYVFSPYQRYGITGWRKNNDSVAAFEFTASPNSYAERTGRPRDVGVIGVALFRERAPVQVHPVAPYHSRNQRLEESASAGAARPAQPSSPAAAPSAAAPYAADSARSEAPAGEMKESNRDKEYNSAKRAAPQAAPKLGTGHGERENSSVTNTEFERETTNPVEVIRIRYDSYANLLALGVIPAPRPVQPRPNPFPDGAVGYVPDPPWYK
jgi:hypothetical protein